MNVKTPTATILLGTGGLLLLAVVGWLTLIGPATSALGATGEARTEAQDRNQFMTLQLNQLRRQAEDLPRTTRLDGRLAEMFPPTADQPGFFAEVSAAATAAGIDARDITALSPGVPVVPEGGTVAVQTVSVSMVGSYAELTDLMAGLERMPRAFLINGVELTSAEDGLTLTLTGSTFVAPPLAPPSGP